MLNKQLPNSMSYRADPECVAFDTFTQSWDGLMFYASPPFICISKVLQNIWQGQATEILIVPDWPSYNHLSQLIIKGFTFTLNGPFDIAKIKTAYHPLILSSMSCFGCQKVIHSS